MLVGEVLKSTMSTMSCGTMVQVAPTLTSGVMCTTATSCLVAWASEVWSARTCKRRLVGLSKFCSSSATSSKAASQLIGSSWSVSGCRPWGRPAGPGSPARNQSNRQF